MICQLGGDGSVTTTSTIRAQFLTEKHGVPNRRVGLIADLRWEAAHG